MSEENTSQDTNQEVVETEDKTLITEEPAPEEDKGPQPLYEDKEEGDNDKTEEPESNTDEDKEADDEKPAESETKASEDNKDYDSLDAPEDSLLTDADMKRILSKSKEEGLSKEAAQKQVEMANDVLKDSRERLDQAHRELSEQWIQETKEDKELGGDNFDESLQLANKAIKKFGSEKFIESLNETKFGNNPEVVRIFARIGKAMSPDQLVISDNNIKTEKTFEEQFYPNDV